MKASTMTGTRFDARGEEGVALIHMAVFLTLLLLFIGLAVDTGRAYVVKAQLTKAVDGAALGAARMLNSGDPRGEAARIFKANFPTGYLGTDLVTDPTADPGFFALDTIPETGSNVVTVTASARLPTTFMRLGHFNDVTITSSGEATRRMVDLSLVLDVSGSIGSKWPAVRDAARAFIDAFDEDADRFALVTYSDGARVKAKMPTSRGFDKDAVIAAVPGTLPGGSTAMVEGLYRGWDEVRSVPNGLQSGLRVIVLFTDGASNSVPGLYDSSPGSAKGLRTSDFPENSPDPDNMTHNYPSLSGLYDTETGNQTAWGSGYGPLSPHWNSTTTLPSVPYLPLTSYHAHHRSSGIPVTFPLQTSALTVDGVPQSTRRYLRNPNSGRYPADVFNTNNASRNLVEIIANAAREDTDGDYRIRIYTIGMGELVRYKLGTIKETSESILMRVANDKRSPDFNPSQREGRYYYAKTAADVGPAFQQLQNQIIRLSK